MALPIEGASLAATDQQALTGEIIFSLVDDYVWATWPGTEATVKLGHCGDVIHMMRDFVAQCECGDRLVWGEIAEEE